MSLAILFIVLGLIMNTCASLVMLYPYLNISRNVDDDYIVKMDQKTGDYTQKKHLKDRTLGLLGFSLFALGFFLQIIGVILQVNYGN